MIEEVVNDRSGRRWTNGEPGPDGRIPGCTFVRTMEEKLDQCRRRTCDRVRA